MTNEQFLIVLMAAFRIDDPDDKACFVDHCKHFFPCVAGGMESSEDRLWNHMVFIRMAKLAGLSQHRFAQILGPNMGLPKHLYSEQ